MAQEPSLKRVTRDEMRKKAEAGGKGCWVDLGEMFLDGAGGPIDYVEAMKCFHKVIDSKTPDYPNAQNAKARYEIGQLHIWGQATDKNIAEGFKWIKSAAMRGDDHARIDTAIMLYNGWGTEKNIPEAIEWLEAARDMGPTEYASTCLFLIYQEQGDHAKAEQIEEKFNQADDTHKILMRAGSYHMLGCMYAEGNWVRQDSGEARRYFTLAAEVGHERAKNALEELDKTQEPREKTSDKPLENRRDFWSERATPKSNEPFKR